jgi:uncharacterized protein YndB with AHSA1/START domain
MAAVEYGSIEREVYVNASPEIAYEVVSKPEHLRQWWPDEAEIEPTVGASGTITFRGATPDDDTVVPITVVETRPPHRFVFRWDYEPGTTPENHNSMLVVFEFEPAGDGTQIRMTETGFREHGWEAAVLEHNYQDHVTGWNYFIPRLGEYVARLVSS